MPDEVRPQLHPAYNAQAAVTEGQIIVAAEITTEGGDLEQLEPIVSATERELSEAGVTERPEVVLADAGPQPGEAPPTPLRDRTRLSRGEPTPTAVPRSRGGRLRATAS
jgi:hypothetical protein